MKKKRERLEIIKDILEEIRVSRKIGPTKLLRKSNLSPQMFKDYLSELKEKEFIEEYRENNKRYFILAKKGSEFLIEYSSILKFIENFGL